MAKVTFQVVEGVDKGRVFRELPTPVTIGREEGNLLRLNDERVSRFHAKVQQDEEDIILTDLDSTNGTRVNGTIVSIRRLRFGDRICIGRSLLLFGSNQEIAARMASLEEQARTIMAQSEPEKENPDDGPATVQSHTVLGAPQSEEAEFDLNIDSDKVTATPEAFFIGTKPLPPLPQKLSPSQAARVCEILEFLHQGLIRATENIQAKEDGTEVNINFSDWQKIQGVQMVLSRYIRGISEPETLND